MEEAASIAGWCVIPSVCYWPYHWMNDCTVSCYLNQWSTSVWFQQLHPCSVWLTSGSFYVQSVLRLDVCPQSNYVLCPTITNRETLLTNIFKIIRIKLFIHQTSKYDVASVHELFKPSPVCGGLFFGSHFNSCLEAKNTEDPGDHTTLQSVTAGDEENWFCACAPKKKIFLN